MNKEKSIVDLADSQLGYRFEVHDAEILESKNL